MQQRVHPLVKFPHVLQPAVQPGPPTTQPESITPHERQQALKLILCDSYFSQTITTWTTGVFMVGIALKLGAPNLLIGLLVAMPALAQLLQAPGIYLVEKIRSRRQITVQSALISRLCLLPMALAPCLPDSAMALWVLTLSYLAHTAIGAVGTCAWNSWMKDLVPLSELGAFFSRKMSLASLITIVLTLLGGFLLTQWGQAFPAHKLAGYSVLFGLAFLAGIMGLPLLNRIPEPPLVSPPEGLVQVPLHQKLCEPFQHKNFRRLLTFMGAWHFAIHLATPFFAVYMLTLLNFSVAKVTLMVIISQIAHISYLGIWGKLADRFSNKAVLLICAPLFLLCLLAWTFATLPNTHAYTTPLIAGLHVVIGISTAGVTLANGNLAMKLAPPAKATVYLATHNMVASVATGLAPLLGGLFADLFARQQLSLVVHWQAASQVMELKTLDFTAWDFFFGFAFLLGVVALSLLKPVREGKPVRQHIFLREMLVETWRSTWHVPVCISSLAYQLTRVNGAQPASTSVIQPPRWRWKSSPAPMIVNESLWPDAPND